MRKFLHSLIKTAVGYRLWAYPFKKAKMRAIQEFLPPARPLRVLDVGCGPGTNVPLFRGWITSEWTWRRPISEAHLGGIRTWPFFRGMPGVST